MATRRRRYGEKRTSIAWLSYVLIFLGALLAIWLTLSLIRGENPFDVLKNVVSKDQKVEPTGEDIGPHKKVIDSLQAVIDSLEHKIDILEGVDDLATAYVRVETSQLNVRSSPSIAASLAFRIPPDSEVKIIEYDSRSYVLDGKSGQWCKILYRGNEGWVWGNYLEVLED